MLNSSGLQSYPAPFPIPPGQPNFYFGYPYFYSTIHPQFIPPYPSPPSYDFSSNSYPFLSTDYNNAYLLSNDIRTKLHAINQQKDFPPGLQNLQNIYVPMVWEILYLNPSQKLGT